MGEDLQGFDSICGFDGGVARGLEPFAQELPIGGDVVYDEEFQKSPNLWKNLCMSFIGCWKRYLSCA